MLTNPEVAVAWFCSACCLVLLGEVPAMRGGQLTKDGLIALAFAGWCPLIIVSVMP